MPIYGYLAADITASQPSQLKEVGFQYSPMKLRQIAAFILRCVDEIEAGKFVDGGRHLSGSDAEWKVSEPEADVIVVPMESY